MTNVEHWAAASEKFGLTASDTAWSNWLLK